MWRDKQIFFLKWHRCDYQEVTFWEWGRLNRRSTDNLVLLLSHAGRQRVCLAHFIFYPYLLQHQHNRLFLKLGFLAQLGKFYKLDEINVASCCWLRFCNKLRDRSQQMFALLGNLKTNKDTELRENLNVEYWIFVGVWQFWSQLLLLANNRLHFNTCLCRLILLSVFLYVHFMSLDIVDPCVSVDIFVIYLTLTDTRQM